jgi:putative membrane protein
MKNLISRHSAIFAALMSAGIAIAADSGSLAGADRNFVIEAAKGGMAEVELGNLAKSKAQNAEVKSFAQRMVDDHSKANDQLKSIASSKGVQLPTSLDKSAQNEKERLSKLSGANFDREYMSHMVKDHKKDVKEFEKQAKNGKDSDVKNFAAQTLPTLQDHLKMAESVEQSAKKSK